MSAVEPGAFFDHVCQVSAHAVVGHAPVYNDSGLGHVGKFDGVVGWGEDCFGEVLSDLIFIDVEGRDDFNVLDAVASDGVVHDARHFGVIRYLHVFVDALYQ